MKSNHPNKGIFGKPDYQTAKQEMLIDNEWQYCTLCMQIKRLDNFRESRTIKAGYTSHCNVCRTNRQAIRESGSRLKDWREKYWHSSGHKKSQLKSLLKRVYGLTLDDYYAMIEEQDNRCGICNSPVNSGRRLSIDHNHDTQEVRGLLCHKCNMGLGMFNEDASLLFKASMYVKLNGVKELAYVR